VKRVRVKTVQTTDEGEYFSVFPEDLGLDRDGYLYVDRRAPALPSEQEAVELLNLGGDIALVDDFDPMWIPVMRRGAQFVRDSMSSVFLEDEEYEEFDEDVPEVGPLPLEIDD
jgi:hypothetical protein